MDLKTPKRDLCLVVADGSMEAVLLTLLTQRLPSLGLSPGALHVELGDITALKGTNDPGVFRQGAEFLRQRQSRYTHGLVLLDAAWDGSPGAQAITKKVSEELQRHGWGANAGVVVIEPELEQWVFMDSPHLEACLAWNSIRDGALRAWLETKDLWPAKVPKPPDPKHALETAMRRTGKRNNPGWLSTLAASPVSLERCQDASFNRLKGLLQGWFKRT